MACLGASEIKASPPPGKEAKISFGSSSQVVTKVKDDDGENEYLKQYRASDGFDIDVYPNKGKLVFNCTLPMDPEQFEEHIGLLIQLSELAIEVYNKDNNTNYKVVKVLKTMQRGCEGFEFRITFEATEDATHGGQAEDATHDNENNGQAKIFQASVWYGAETEEVFFCRLKKPQIN